MCPSAPVGPDGDRWGGRRSPANVEGQSVSSGRDDLGGSCAHDLDDDAPLRAFDENPPFPWRDLEAPEGGWGVWGHGDPDSSRGVQSRSAVGVRGKEISRDLDPTPGALNSDRSPLSSSPDNGAQKPGVLTFEGHKSKRRFEDSPRVTGDFLSAPKVRARSPGRSREQYEIGLAGEDVGAVAQFVTQGSFAEIRRPVMSQITVVDPEHVDRGKAGEIRQATAGFDREERAPGTEYVGEERADDLPIPLPSFRVGADVFGIQELEAQENEG